MKLHSLSEGFDAWLHAAGITLKENKAGQRNKTDERQCARQWSGHSLRPHAATSNWGGHRMVRRKFGHPCAEKEARLRPQQQLSGGTGCVTSRMHGAYVCGGRFDMTLIEARRNFFRRSGMGNSFTDAHPRGAAVAQRLRSASLAGCRRSGRKATRRADHVGSKPSPAPTNFVTPRK
jgi:hypothetical protein